MDAGGTFWSSEYLNRLRAILANYQAEGQEIYLVGGVVRDALLNRPIHDIDLALNGDVKSLARRVADTLGAAFYMLDDERNTARVIHRQGSITTSLDFAALRGNGIHADLKARDLTVNAIAVNTHQLGQLIDPMGGIADLRAKRLVACTPTSFDDDPARILRTVRLALDLGFRIEPQTYHWMENAVPLLDSVSKERQRDELFRMLDGKSVASAVRILDHVGALESILPELGDLKGVQQSAPHTLDVWEHTLAVLQELEVLLHLLVDDFDSDAVADLMHGTASMGLARYRDRFREHFSRAFNPNRSIRSLLFFAALYHDAAKPTTRMVEESGRVRFFEHEVVGMRMAARRAHELALSQMEIARLEDVIHNHMRIHLLVQSMESPSRRAIYRFFRAAGPAGVDLCLLALADTLATYRHTLSQQHWMKEIEFTRILLEAWWDKPAEVVRPPRLVSGNDLMEAFHLGPGPLVGELLEAIQEAQACGEISTREEALHLAEQVQIKPESFLNSSES
jgi:tRNA nucleotidyltransferase/poly(A) polymerase